MDLNRLAMMLLKHHRHVIVMDEQIVLRKRNRIRLNDRTQSDRNCRARTAGTNPAEPPRRRSYRSRSASGSCSYNFTSIDSRFPFRFSHPRLRGVLQTFMYIEYSGTPAQRTAAAANPLAKVPDASADSIASDGRVSLFDQRVETFAEFAGDLRSEFLAEIAGVELPGLQQQDHLADQQLMLR